MEEQLKAAAKAIAQAKSVVALTGAGISVDSGIPDFRGSQGLWEKYDPMEYATIQAFKTNPGKVWVMLKEMEGLVLGARPNPAHEALAKLEAMGRLEMVVTQNIDGLHQAAGSRTVIEFHGSGRRLVCLDCTRKISRGELVGVEVPPRCVCGGLIKPDVVFFGEPIPQRPGLVAMAASQSCQAMLVVGTSATVVPASQLPMMAKQAGATVIEVNLEATPLTGHVADISLQGGASDIMPRLADMVRELVS